MPEYRIDLNVNNAPAERSARRASSLLAEVEKAAKRAADAQEREAIRAAAAVEREVNRQVRADQRAIEQQLRNDERFRDRQVRNAQRAGESMERERQRQAMALSRAMDREVAEHERAARKASAAHKKSSEESGEATKGFAESFVGGLKGIAGAFVGIQSASRIVNAIIDNFVAAKQSAYDAAQQVQDYRAALQELAALKGQMGGGGTTQALKETIELRTATLQNRADATAFQNAILGVGESVIDTDDQQKLISKEEFAKLTKLSGSFQAAEGGSATTHARLAGMIPQMMGRRTTADEAFQKEMQLYNIFKPGGAEFSGMTDQFLKLMPLITSGVLKDTEAAALESGFSTTAPTEAGTMVEWLTRATVGGMGRMRGQGVEGSEKQGEYLKGLEVTNQMSAVDIATRISEDLKAQEVEAKDRGEEFNAYDYLKHHGYANQEDIKAVLAFHGLKQSGQWDTTFAKLADKMPTAEEAQQPVRDFQASDPRAMTLKRELAEDLGSVAQGAGKNEFLENARRIAFERLKTEGRAYGKFEEWRDDMRWGGRGKIDESVLGMQTVAAEKAGIKFKTRRDVSDVSGDDYIFNRGMELARGGVDPLGRGMDKLIDAANKQLDATKRMEAALKEGQAKRQAAPIPPKPPGNVPR